MEYFITDHNKYLIYDLSYEMKTGKVLKYNKLAQ